MPGADAPPAGVVTGVAYDSRAVKPGHVFVALKGLHADGVSFAQQAIERGAVAIVSEQPAPFDVQVPWAMVGDARLALALLAAAFHHHPSAEMQVVGITGTNGKTTTAYLIASIFDAAGIRCGVLGTVAYRIGDQIRDATRTTPEAPDVQGLLREMVDRGCGACAMEVSSHALSLRRVDGTTFAAGGVHQPHARSSRFPRRHGRLLPGEAAALRNVAARRAEPDESRRSTGGRADRASWAGRSPTPSIVPPTSCRARSRFRSKA